jgi:RNA polymerase sigma-70 factor, ECF subfamily
VNQPPSLHKALKGDKQALEELACFCWPVVFKYQMRLCGSREQAQDLAQDTMVRMLESLGTYHPHAGAGYLAWVFRIARNRFIDETRHNRQAALPIGDEVPGPAGFDTTSSSALSRMEAKNLGRALARLSSGDRELLELRWFFGFSHKEISGILGVGPPVVKSRLNAALGRLGKQFAVEEVGCSDGNAKGEMQRD